MIFRVFHTQYPHAFAKVVIHLLDFMNVQIEALSLKGLFHLASNRLAISYLVVIDFYLARHLR